MANSLVSLALRLHEEKSTSITTTIIAVEPISSLSEVDHALFKQASDENRIVITTETVFTLKEVVSQVTQAL